MPAGLDGPEMVLLAVLPRPRLLRGRPTLGGLVGVIRQLLFTARANDGQVGASVTRKARPGCRWRFEGRFRGFSAVMQAISLVVELNRVFGEGIVDDRVVANNLNLDADINAIATKVQALEGSVE